MLKYFEYTRQLKKEDAPRFFQNCLDDLLDELLNETKVCGGKKNWENCIISNKQINNPYPGLFSQEIKKDSAETYGVIAQRYNAK